MTGSSSPRILTCAYNRRRDRSFHPHIETGGTMNVQNLKLASKMGPMMMMKPPRSVPSKLSSLESSSSTSENIQEWFSLNELMHEKRCCEETKGSSSDSSELEREDGPSSIFRSMADYDDQDDIMVLKRANPVYDSDDEDSFAAPAKRQRTSSSSSETVLQWGARLQDDHDQSVGFCIHFEQH
jgi:hypothetical protein